MFACQQIANRKTQIAPYYLAVVNLAVFFFNMHGYLELILYQILLW